MKKIKNNLYSISKDGDNAYLITGDINVLIDGLKEEYSNEFIAEIETVVPIKNIDFAVINHCEMNRVGTLLSIIEANPKITVISTTAGLKFLDKLITIPFNKKLAKDNMKLSINGKIMEFILAPYINWPDSMITLYDGCAFTSDLFSSTHLGPSDYYKTYLSSHSEYVNNAIEKLKEKSFNKICPGTGFGVFDSTDKFLIDYQKIIKVNYKDIVLLYSSVYGNTFEMANVVNDEFKSMGYSINMLDISVGLYDEISDRINASSALIIATNTINSDAPKSLWSVIAKTDKVTNKHKPCMILGSYGWGGEALYFMENHLKMLRYNVFDKPFGVIFKMNDKERNELKEYTKRFIEFLKQ